MKNDENVEPERTLNMVTGNQAMSSLQTFKHFVGSVESVDTCVFEAIGELKDSLKSTATKPKMNDKLFLCCIQ